MSPSNSQKSRAEVRAEIEEVMRRQDEEEKERKKRQEELVRQLAELKAAEEVEKAAEEAEAQRKRAEETARLQGVSGGSEEDRMDVDVAAEGKKGKEKAKKDEEDGENGEGKKMELVSGKNRCRTCVRDKAECRIDSDAITRWREHVQAGKVTARAPAGTSCERCHDFLKKPCEFPGTADLREAVAQRKAEIAEEKKKKTVEGKTKAEVKKGGVRGGSEASGSKRKASSVEVVMPPRKKVRQNAEMTEGQFRASVAATLGRVAVAAERTATQLDSVRLSLHLQNMLLQRFVATQEGAAAATGQLPTESWSEANWKKADNVYGAEEVTEGDYETEEEGTESEEGTEEVSEDE